MNKSIWKSICSKFCPRNNKESKNICNRYIKKGKPFSEYGKFNDTMYFSTDMNKATVKQNGKRNGRRRPSPTMQVNLDSYGKSAEKEGYNNNENANINNNYDQCNNDGNRDVNRTNVNIYGKNDNNENMLISLFDVIKSEFNNKESRPILGSTQKVKIIFEIARVFDGIHRIYKPHRQLIPHLINLDRELLPDFDSLLEPNRDNNSKNDNNDLETFF